MEKSLRTCPNGHNFYKSSDCPTCPICEQERQPVSDFLTQLSSPARRALENQGIVTIEKLSKYSESEILKLHGMGPGSIPTLRAILAKSGLSFKQKVTHSTKLD